MGLRCSTVRIRTRRRSMRWLGRQLSCGRITLVRTRARADWWSGRVRAEWLRTRVWGLRGSGWSRWLSLTSARPNAVPLAELQGLGRFIVFLQRSDGSFASKYRPAGGPVEDWDSLYYPGEAALGLVSLYEVDHSRQWLIAAGKALSYLARSRVASRGSSAGSLGADCDGQASSALRPERLRRLARGTDRLCRAGERQPAARSG